MRSDLLYAARALGRMPVLAAVIILSLGIGIGVNATVFSFVQSRVLKPLPGVRDAGSVQLIEPRAETGSYPGASWAEFRDVSERLTAFEQVFAFRIQALSVGAPPEIARVSGLLVSGNYFDALGLRAAAGRLLTPADTARPGGTPVVVLSHDYWQTRFAGAVDVIGRSMRVNGTPLTIVGVTPEAFEGTVIGLTFDLWVPATLAPVLMNGSRELEERGIRGYQMAGRLRTDATVARAEAELASAMRELATAFPETNKGVGAELLPFWSSPRGPQRMLTYALAGMQGLMFILLLAVCSNVATLLLARTTARGQEVAVRLALGARPARVLRLLTAEHVLLALGAALVGVAVAIVGTQNISAIPLTSGFPVRTSADVDAGVVAFAIVLALVSVVLFGAAPALQLLRIEPGGALRPGARATMHGWAGRLVMGVQVALALAVLIAAGLFYRSLQSAQDLDPGFAPDGVLLARYDLTGRSVLGSEARDFAERALAGVRALPGADAAAIAQQVPLDIHGLPLISFTLEGRPRTDGAQDRALSNVVTPGYFATMQIEMIAGRDFAALGDRTAPRQAIVDDAFVQRYIAPGEPLGRRVQIGGRAYEIIAVVRNSVADSFGEAAAPTIYLSYRDRPSPVGQLHVRTRAGQEPQFAGAMRGVVSGIDPTLTAYDIRTLRDHIEINLGLRKIPARMFMVLGPLLLVLAAIGVYAVVAYAVAQRRREVGVRLALGAPAARVVREMVQDHLWIVGIGSAFGLVLAAWVYVRLLRQPPDWLVFAGVPTLLLAVSALAAWIPARRAAHIDPVTTLRE